MEYGLIGERLSHSFSAEIHSSVFGYDYKLCPLNSAEVEDFFKERKFKAINVTIPYKQTVIPLLNEIDKVAARIGAVNTVVNKNGKLYGYNTDHFGMTALIKRANIDVADKKVLILGSGGTSKTAKAVCEDLGAREVYVVSRGESADTITYECAKKNHNNAEIIINTTPCGMYPNSNISAVDLDDYPNLSGVIDVVYNPLRTPLIISAAKKGIKCAGGLYMLVAQAVKAGELFTGKTVKPSVIDKAFLDVYGKKQNLVLIGMPSCGKTTLGKEIAKLLGRPFIDTDEEIVKKAGKSIPEIFETDGSDAFRTWETEVIKEVSSQSGRVIATGGGTVLKQENVDLLKSNGKVLFIDRPLSELIVTDDRPLSSSKEKLEKLYAERYGIYLAAADEKIDVINDIKKNTEKIKEAFFNENFCN